jgi:hypothetical protein
VTSFPSTLTILSPLERTCFHPCISAGASTAGARGTAVSIQSHLRVVGRCAEYDVVHDHSREHQSNLCIDAKADLAGPQTRSEKAKTDNGAKGFIHSPHAATEIECGLQERVPEREGAPISRSRPEARQNRGAYFADPAVRHCRLVGARGALGHEVSAHLPILKSHCPSIFTIYKRTFENETPTNVSQRCGHWWQQSLRATRGGRSPCRACDHRAGPPW